MKEKITNAEVGQELITECKKCKSEMTHVITVIKDGVIKKVMCKGCLTTHVYRAEPAKATARKTPRTRTSRRASWSTLVADIDDDQLVDYEIDKDFTEIRAIRHRQFGVGVVTKVISDNKIEVVFQDGKKILAHNWQ